MGKGLRAQIGHGRLEHLVEGAHLHCGSSGQMASSQEHQGEQLESVRYDTRLSQKVAIPVDEGAEVNVDDSHAAGILLGVGNGLDEVVTFL